jgi:hypothetical protein
MWNEVGGPPLPLDMVFQVLRWVIVWWYNPPAGIAALHLILSSVGLKVKQV